MQFKKKCQLNECKEKFWNCFGHILWLFFAFCSPDELRNSSNSMYKRAHKPGAIFISMETLVFFLNLHRPFLQFEIAISSSVNCLADLPMETSSSDLLLLVAF